jgi:hypothetical protein
MCLRHTEPSHLIAQYLVGHISSKTIGFGNGHRPLFAHRDCAQDLMPAADCVAKILVGHSLYHGLPEPALHIGAASAPPIAGRSVLRAQLPQTHECLLRSG